MSSQKQHVVLPATTLTIPSLPSPSRSNGPQPSSLKIRIIPHLSVPSPPFAQGVSGKKVEDCVDVIADIGGKVDLGLEVDEDGLGWAEGREWDVEERIRDRVKGLFEANTSALALSSVSTPSFDAPPSPSPEESASSSSSSPALPRPLIRLSPLIANPAHSHLLKTLTTTGRPQATLTRFDMKLEWVASGTKQKRRGDEEDGEGEKESQSQSQSQSQEGGGSKVDGDGEEWWVTNETGTAGGLGMDLIMSDVEESTGGGKEDREAEEQLGLPKWVEAQLKSGMHKVMRTHMIRRFPLLFDSALIHHAPSLTMHRSLTSSLTHFLHLSSTHQTSLLQPGRNLLRSIAQEQETFLTLNVDAAAALRGVAIPKPIGAGRRGKRRKIGAAGDGNEEERVGADDTKAGRSRAYLDQVHKGVMAEDKGPRADERRIGRLVGEAMGRVGKAKWDVARKGAGRMAAFRVPLKDVDPAQQAIPTENDPSGGLPAIIDRPDDSLEPDDAPEDAFQSYIDPSPFIGLLHDADGEEADPDPEDRDSQILLDDWDDIFDPDSNPAQSYSGEIDIMPGIQDSLSSTELELEQDESLRGSHPDSASQRIDDEDENDLIFEDGRRSRRLILPHWYEDDNDGGGGGGSGGGAGGMMDVGEDETEEGGMMILEDDLLIDI